MDIEDKQFIVGIDHGTTNSVVSFVNLSENKKSDSTKGHHVRKLTIPQLTGEGEISRISVLLSFLYIPGEYDISKEAIMHPWKKENDNFAGTFVRDHGAKIPSNLVSSAKRWPLAMVMWTKRQGFFPGVPEMKYSKYLRLKKRLHI